MTRERYSVDAEELFVKLTQQAMPDYEVRSEVDVDTVEALPLIIVSAGQGSAVEGQRGLGWVWQAHFSVLASTHEEAGDVADELHEKIDSWANSWDPTVGMIAGVGAITNIEDISLFSRTATTLTPAGGLTQYGGNFAITIRKA